MGILWGAIVEILIHMMPGINFSYAHLKNCPPNITKIGVQLVSDY